MSLNVATLSLLAALLLGAAAVLLGLEAQRLSSALLPGLLPAAAFTAPALAAAFLLGVAGAARRARAAGPPLPAAARWLVAGAAATLAGAMLLRFWVDPAPPYEGARRDLAAVLPFAPALACLGAALTALLRARLAGGARALPAHAGLLLALGAGALLGARGWLPLLADPAGVPPLTLAAAGLAAAGVVCWLLQAFAAPQPAAGTAARGASTGGLLCAGVLGGAMLAAATLSPAAAPARHAHAAPRAVVPAALERRMGRISASFAPEARRALVLGVGSGRMLASLAAVSPASVEAVEEDPALLATLEELPFEGEQQARGGPPSVNLQAEQVWLRELRGAYDLVVVAPPPVPRTADADACSRERFLALRGALAPRGVVVQWLALDALSWPAFASAARTFVDVFPDARLFVASLRADVPLVALVGGLIDGLPRHELVDALLAHAPSAVGPPAAVDVLDLYVCDAWTLMGAVRDAPLDTLDQPWLALSMLRRSASAGDAGGPAAAGGDATEDAAAAAADAAWLARSNLRRLAELTLPLDTTSLQARPVSDKENRELGAELTARSAALTNLLFARAAWLELRDSEPGSLSATEREALENELGGALLAAWKAAPGHLDVRDTLAEWSSELVRQERWEVAGSLLQAALEILQEGRLAGLLGGILVHLDHVEAALPLLEHARSLAPGDRTVLANLATAQLFAGQDEAARATLTAARAAFAPAGLPPQLDVALQLLDGRQEAVAPARALLAQIPAGEPWGATLERLLQRPPPSAPPPR